MKLPVSVVLKMNNDQFEDYCEKRGVGYRAALRYYQTCQLRQNRLRVRRLSRATQKQWWKTRQVLYYWLGDFYDWREQTAGDGTWQMDGWLIAHVQIEQGMSHVLDGYSCPSISRYRSHKIAERAFSKVKQDILRSKPIEPEHRSHYQLAQSVLLKSTRNVEHIAGMKLPLTQKAIAECVEKVYDDAPQ